MTTFYRFKYVTKMKINQDTVKYRDDYENKLIFWEELTNLQQVGWDEFFENNYSDTIILPDTLRKRYYLSLSNAYLHYANSQEVKNILKEYSDNE